MTHVILNAAPDTARRDTFSHLLRRFLLYKGGLSPRTIEAYENNLGHFSWWLVNVLSPGFEPKLSNIHAEEILSFYQYMRGSHPRGRWGIKMHHTTGPVSEGTIRAHHVSLKVFFGWAYEQGHLKRSPFDRHAVPEPKAPAPNVKPFSTDDVQLLIAACRGMSSSPIHKPGNPSNGHAAARNLAIVLVMASSGLRVSELCGVKLDDIDELSDAVATCAIEIVGKGGKRRDVIVGKRATDALWEYVTMHRPQHGDKYVFLTDEGKQMNRNTVAKMLHRIAEKAGVSMPRSHRLRHFFATESLRNGAPQGLVQRLIGHSSDRTIHIYADFANLAGSMHPGFDPIDNMEKPTATRRRKR